MVQSGGVGPFGVIAAMENLGRAHEIAEQGTGMQLRIEKVEGRTRFLVPAKVAGGIWLEFEQK